MTHRNLHVRLVFGGLAILLPTIPAHAILDANGNGMSDVWERLHNHGALFDPGNPDHAPGADPDGDGMTNLKEAAAGTNPFKAEPLGQRFEAAVRAIPHSDGSFELSFPSDFWKQYQTHYSFDLSAWQILERPASATPFRGAGQEIRYGIQAKLLRFKSSKPRNDQ